MESYRSQQKARFQETKSQKDKIATAQQRGTNSPVKPAKVTQAKTTFKDVLLRNKVPEKQQEDAAEAIESLQPPQRKYSQPSKFFPTRKQTLNNPDLDVIYSGMKRQDLGKVRRQLAALGVNCQKIHNIHFIGKAIAEFIMEKDYVEDAKRICRSFGFSVIEGYNPSASRATQVTETMKQEIRKNFKQRMATLLNYRVKLTKPSTFSQFEKDPVVKFVNSKLEQAKIPINTGILFAAASEAAKKQ